MEKSKHTPGPWKWYGDKAGWQLLENDNGKVVLACDILICSETDMAAIAALPDLLEACKRLTQLNAPPFVDEHSPYWALNEDDRNTILAAIAKAEGSPSPEH